MDFINTIKILSTILIPFFSLYPIKYAFEYLFNRDRILLDKLNLLEKHNDIIKDQTIFEKFRKTIYVHIVYGLKFKNIDLACYIVDKNINYEGSYYLFKAQKIISFENNKLKIDPFAQKMLYFNIPFGLAFYGVSCIFMYQILDTQEYVLNGIYFLLSSFASLLYFNLPLNMWLFKKFNETKHSKTYDI
ncbi:MULTISPECIES: hypothetical protein [unclassified Sulfurospirillum]|uniref:hypothetical protein n=1 Tax=unclassified Sulfurospirillum TaxID=2618290 RepID=UPI000500772B|nr:MULTISPECIES: hypothetical protein [unclassified Sulfurospirillum]KFL34837.1 hypothetical protein JU57_04200 [Sulfurospirillum sp. SCADC]